MAERACSPGSEDARQGKFRDQGRQFTGTVPIRSVVEIIPGPALCLSTTNEVLDLNQEAEAVLGVSRDDIIGKDYVKEFLPEEMRKDVTDYIKQVMKGRKTRGYRNCVRRTDGTEHVLLWNVNRIVDENDEPVGIVAVATDVTNTERHKHLMKAQRDLAAKLAGTGNLAEGLRLCVKAAIRIAGMDCGGVYLLRKDTGALELAYHEGLTEQFVRAASHYEKNSTNTLLVMNGEASYAEGPEASRLGSTAASHENLRVIAVLPLLCQGEVVGCLNVASHTSENISQWSRNALESISAQIGNTIVRLQAQESLHHSQAWLGSVLESSPAAILVLDKEANILRCNHATVDMRGLATTEEMIGRSAFDFISADDMQRAKEGIAGTLDGNPINDAEFTLVDREGCKFPVLLSTSIIKDALGNISGIVASVQDITRQKQTQEALRETTARLQSTFDSSPDGITVADMQGTITDCNQATVRMHAFSEKQEIIGLNVLDLVASSDHERALENTEVTLREGFVRNLEYMLRRKDGSEFPGELSAGVIRDEGGMAVGLVGITKDITERKLAESALRESEEKYRKLIDDSLLGVTLVQDGRCVFANRAAVQMMGHSAQELASLSPEELLNVIHPDDQRMVFENMMSRLQGEESPEELQYRIIRKDGTVRWLQVTASIRNVNGSSVVQTYNIDITDRKLAEEELKVSEEKFRRMFELSPYSSVYSDLKGNILLCNRQFAVMHATEGGPEDMVGRNVSEFFPEEERPRLFESIKRKLEEDKALGPIEYTMLREDGTTFPAMADSTLVRDQNGKPVGLVAMAQDITARKASERSFLEHQVKLKSLASKLALAEEQERRRLAGYIHDELGQRLAMTKLQLKSSLQPLPADSCTPGISGVFESIDQLIDHVHNLTFELSSPLLHEIGLTAAIESWLDSEVQNKHGIMCKVRSNAELTDLEPDLATVLFRNTRELLTNVVKHGQASNITVGLQKTDGQIRIQVVDDGVGFARGKLRLMPDEFGGFGLFSIREQIEYMGGTLDIESAPNQGTRVVMTAPLGQNDAGDKGQTEG